MPSDFDARLHDLLDDAAREIPPDATVIPGLLRQIAVDTRVRRSPLRQSYRFIAPLVAVIIVVAIAMTFVAFHTAQRRGVATAPATATATATLAPASSFTPSTVSAHGLTVQLDSVDANAFRIAVGYHVVTPTPSPGDEYIANAVLTDDQGLLHYQVADTITYPHGTTGAEFDTFYFAPLAPAQVAAHILTFSLPTILVAGSESHPSKNFLSGPWNFTLHVTPAMSGTKMLTVPSETVGGITVTPQSVEWVNGADPVNSQGVNFRLALSGFPKVRDPQSAPGLFMTTLYKNSAGGAGGTGNAGGSPGHPVKQFSTDTLTLPDGKVVQPFAYFSIANNHFDPSHANAEGFFTGVVAADGSVVVDAGFQGVTLTTGETVQLTISNIGLNGQTITSYPGPWTFTLTV